jgi:hypothetical protein
MGAYKNKMLEEMDDEDHTDEYGASMDNDDPKSLWDEEDKFEDDLIERSIEDEEDKFEADHKDGADAFRKAKNNG